MQRTGGVTVTEEITTEELMRSYYAAYNAIDAEALAALLAPDVMLVSAMGEQRGRDAYLATYAFMTGAFIDRMHPESIDIAGNVATVRIRNELTARQDIPEFMGQPVAKGQQIVLNLVGTYTIANGTITRIEISPAA